MPPPLACPLLCILSVGETTLQGWRGGGGGREGRAGTWGSGLSWAGLPGSRDSWRDRHPRGIYSGRDDFILSRCQHLGTASSISLSCLSPHSQVGGRLVRGPLPHPTCLAHLLASLLGGFCFSLHLLHVSLLFPVFLLTFLPFSPSALPPHCFLFLLSLSFSCSFLPSLVLLICGMGMEVPSFLELLGGEELISACPLCPLWRGGAGLAGPGRCEHGQRPVLPLKELTTRWESSSDAR